MMADPKHLYREIVDLERQLRELLRANPLNAQDANVLRSRLIERAKALASASPAFAASKEIEQVLWKPCFYKRIEDFRLRIRKYAAAPASDRSGVREHFARVSSDFQAFLRDAAAFYDHVRASYSAWLEAHYARIATSGAAAAVAVPDSATAALVLSATKCRTSLHRCYIFLGDLARYRELHSQRAKKNFAAAESFYHKALALVPANGNPHNQLAVLATYVEAETVAVYRYCRSLLIAQPFATAEENLALLFERARQRPLASTSVAPAPLRALTAASSAKDKSAGLKSFLHRLTRLHGILFALATAAGPGTGSQSSGGGGHTMAPSTSSASAAVPVYPVEMETAVLADLRALLRAGAIGDALLLKVVVIHVFCVVRALRSASASAQTHAVALAARTLAAVMAFVHDELARPSGTSGSGTRLLGPVSVFCDFLRLWPAAIDVLDAGTSAGASGLSDEPSAASAFLEAFTALVNHAKLRELYAPLAALRNDQQAPLRAQQLLLKENIELRGFAPFAALLESPAAAATTTTATVTVVPEPEALRLRAWNVWGFGRFLCDEYAGNPLLFCYQCVFATTPVVGGGSGSFLHAVAGVGAGASARSTAFNGFGGGASAAAVEPRGGSSFVTPPKHAIAQRVNDDDDDFDDEVIVFQPSPALSPQPSTASAALGGGRSGTSTSGNGGDLTASWLTGGLTTSTSSTVSPFADLGVTFSLGAPNSQSTPEPKRHSFSDAFSSGGNSSGFGGGVSTGGGIGATLGYPNFHSFGGDFGGFSGRGLLAGWGNSDDAMAPPGASGTGAPAPGAVGASLGRPPSVPKPSTAFGSLSGVGTSTGVPFAPMLDLAAVERESALYQQEASSLSAFFSASVPLPQRSNSTSSLSDTRTSPRPPPGFGGAAAPAANAPQFYTRNPFINP